MLDHPTSNRLAERILRDLRIKPIPALVAKVAVTIRVACNEIEAAAYPLSASKAKPIDRSKWTNPEEVVSGFSAE